MKKILNLFLLIPLYNLNAQIPDTSLFYNQGIIYAAYDSPQDAYWRERRPSYCWTWESLRDSIREVQGNYFVQNIFNPALNNPDISKENIEFLKKLKFYLEDEEYHAFDGPDPFIMPVFQAYDPMDQEYYVGNISIDSSVRKTYYVTNLSSTRKTMAIGPSIYQWINTCAEWPCKLKKNGWMEKFNPLIATTLNIELDFGSNAEMDSLLGNDNKASSECTFCKTWDSQYTFATLKGVPGLYFTYTPGVQETGRSLVIKMGNHPAFLWRFTCDCK